LQEFFFGLISKTINSSHTALNNVAATKVYSLKIINRLPEFKQF